MKKNIIILITLLSFFLSCAKYEHKPLTSGEKPERLTDLVVKNLPGSAEITYTVPDDPNILYVEAIYELNNGQKKSAKASVFQNYIVLQGFNDTSERQISLYVVNRSEERSIPVDVKIKPLISPMESVFESLSVEGTFGGVTVSFENNDDENKYVLVTIMKDNSNEWVIYDRLHTSAKRKEYSEYGLSARPIEFGFYLIDEYQNYSDTLFETLTPRFEEKLDKNLWNLYPLDNDTYKSKSASRLPELMWDESTTTMPYQIENDELPAWITIDMGQKAYLSRFVYNTYSEHNYDWFFAQDTPEEFEIWGSNDPSKDGDWANWHLLGKKKTEKPSGLPRKQFSDDDIQAGLSGSSLILNTDKAFRYFRFKTISTWDKLTSITIGEFTMYGAPE